MGLTRGHAGQHRMHRNSTGVAALLLLALVLGGCGIPDTATVGVALLEPTGTPTLAPATATPTTAPTIPPTIPPTATSAGSPTAPLPSAPTQPASTTPSSGRPSTPPTADGGYVADWSKWEVDPTPTTDYRRTYNAPNNEYHVALFTDASNGQEWSFYAPEGKKFQNFTLELEAYPVDGPDSLGYGVVFRRQPKQGDKASERYIFYVTPQGRFTLFQVTPDNNRKTLRNLDAPDKPGVIKVGKAPNRLKVTCQGTTITLAINDLDVFTLTNAAISQPGEIGIFATAPAGGQAAEIAYSDLRLTPLP